MVEGSASQDFLENVNKFKAEAKTILAGLDQRSANIEVEVKK